MKLFRFAGLTAALVTLSLLFACTPVSTVPPENSLTFTDDLGRTVTLPAAPKKTAAVTGSFAEVWQLAGGTLAAATQDAWNEDKLPADSNAVNLGAMKSPSVEQMLEEGIDFVILSANIEEHVQLQSQLETLSIPCAYFEVELFQDYLRMLKTCTGITGRADLYEKNGLAVQARIDNAIARAEGQPTPTVLFIRAFSTGARAKGSDNMTGAMLKELGCINIADREVSLLDDLSLETIIEEDPEYILFVTMGESEEKALASMKTLLEDNPAFEGLTAVKNGRYTLLPKDLFHLKPNNRWGESYEMLADILYE